MFKLKFSSQKITEEDCLYIKKAAKFAIQNLYLEDLIKKNSIFCEITDFVEEDCLGLCFDNGTKNIKRKIEIQISSKTIKNYKNIRSRLKQTIKTLFHELVHTKQYLLNELVHHEDDSYSYKGIRHYPNLNDDISSFTSYYMNPAEIEAYGLETCLYDLFEVYLKKEKAFKNG